MPRIVRKNGIFTNFLQAFGILLHFKFKHYLGLIMCILFVWIINTNAKSAEYLLSSIRDINWRFISILDFDSFFKHQKKKIEHALFNKQVLALQSENALLKDKISSLELLENENKRLREALEVKLGSTKLIATTTLVRSTLDFSNQSFLIPIGAKDGIESGDFVMSMSTLIGKITDITDSFAMVEMISNKYSKTPILFSESNQRGIITGNSIGKSMMTVLYAYDEDAILDGEIVLTTGDGSIYPHGLKVGKALRNGSDILIEPLYDLSKVVWVSVYKHY